MWIFSKHSRFFSPKTLARGFTLIELLMVIAIIAILTSFILLRQSKFNSSTILRSLSYSVALTTRQAQIYGTSVYGQTTSSGVTFAPGYGVSFTSGDPTHYVLFADLTGAYDYTTALSQKVKLFTLNQGYSIKSFCAITAFAVRHCSSDGSITWITILFKRPNPDAYVYASDGGAYVDAYVQIQSGDGTTRSILVSSTGQIAVGALGS